MATAATAATFNCSASFDALFDAQCLQDLFSSRFQHSPAKGVDRLNGYQFAARAPVDLNVTSRKCSDGTFRFSPYLEQLRPKNRSSKPRMISIPTIRDRVVLHQLKELLALAFPESIPRQMAAEIMRSLTASLASASITTTWVAGCDIQDFYPSIDHTRLLTLLRTRLSDDRALTLVRRALATPTVPLHSRRHEYKKYTSTIGIPQGLAISNILASIYMGPIDRGMNTLAVSYTRYVDDVLITGPEDAVRAANKSFLARARARRLKVHSVGSGKSHLTRLDSGFSYLGYVFRPPLVTVRPATVDRLLHSIASKFSDYRHNKERRLRRAPYLDDARYRDIFLDELNERITGAVSENRRYGWVAYFSQINHLELLHKLDSTVSGMFSRMPDFGRAPPTTLKKFARAFFEIKFNPHGGYVRNFDEFVTFLDKLRFLERRGLVAPGEALTQEQIESRFDSVRRRILGEMLADEGMIY